MNLIAPLEKLFTIEKSLKRLQNHGLVSESLVTLCRREHRGAYIWDQTRLSYQGF